MCSTCNYTKYIKAEKIVNKRTIEFLRADNAHLGIDMNCDIDGKNFKIGDFTIYRCPTCGRKLF